MGSIISAIHDDIEEYQALCRRYNEPVVSTFTAQGHLLPDPYGEHANALKKRRDDEYNSSKKGS